MFKHVQLHQLLFRENIIIFLGKMPTSCKWCVKYHIFPFGNLKSFTSNLYECPHTPIPKVGKLDPMAQMVVDHQWLLVGTQCCLGNS
jgi:hypothetical protein